MPLVAPVFRGGRPTLCSDEMFVKIYMECYRKRKTLGTTAIRMGYASEQSVKQRADKLRTLGVQLPYFSTKRATDVNALNSLILGS